MELCYRNNPKSLFRKYAQLVTWFANQGIGRDYLGLPRTKIALMLPNGYHEDGGKGYYRATFYTRPVYSPKLYKYLFYLDNVSQWIADFGEAKQLLAWQAGLTRKMPDIAKALHLTVTTKYPDPNPETTSVDGNVAREISSETWATIRAGAGTNAYPTNVALHCWYTAASTTTNQFSGLYRFIALFDTSSIPDTDTVSAATLSLWGRSRVEDLGAYATAIVGSTPASNTDLVAADYGQLGTTRFATDLATWPTAQYNDFALNASGIAAISTTGVSKFGTRMANDIDNSAPSWTSTLDCNAGTYAADQADTTNDPKLVVTHAVASDTFLSRLALLGIG